MRILAGILLRFGELPATWMAGEPPGADHHIFAVGSGLCNKGKTVDKIASSLARTALVYAENPCCSSGNHLRMKRPEMRAAAGLRERLSYMLIGSRRLQMVYRHERLRHEGRRLCLSKISKCLSGRELYFCHNSRRCSFLSRQSSPHCLPSSVRVLRSNLITWRCAIKSACFSGRQESARN